MTDKAVIYARVSTIRQAERDLSIPDQIAQCRAYCANRGWDVVDVYTEPGASALDDDRPVFQEMIDATKVGGKKFGYVVVHSLSRFSRDSQHSEFYVRVLRKSGVELISITQDVGQGSGGEKVRKVFNIFDEYHSRENAKHTHRAMCENTRQGFWNGAPPPYGYASVIKERRGSKDKKVLVVHEDEARVIRRIFAMAIGEDAQPMGVKNIAVWLNARGYDRRGVRFSTGSVHKILTSTCYYGKHFFNRFDSRQRKPHPPSRWIGLDVPAIIDEHTFNVVQGLLQSRAPTRIPPRVANGPTFLAGIARCASCNAALIKNSGKGGRYNYYCCSRRLKEGSFACDGLRMPMDKLDGIVLAEVTDKVLRPVHLEQLLESYIQSASAHVDEHKARLAKLKREHTEADASIRRLLNVVATGVMDAEDAIFREQITAARLNRDHIAQEIEDARRRVADAKPIITAEKVARVGNLIRDRLHNGAPELRQAYARLLIDNVSVSGQEIHISGSKAVLAKTTQTDVDTATSGVLSFVREWRARGDETANSYAIELAC